MEEKNREWEQTQRVVSKSGKSVFILQRVHLHRFQRPPGRACSDKCIMHMWVHMVSDGYGDLPRHFTYFNTPNPFIDRPIKQHQPSPYSVTYRVLPMSHSSNILISHATLSSALEEAAVSRLKSIPHLESCTCSPPCAQLLAPLLTAPRPSSQPLHSRWVRHGPPTSPNCQR